MKIYFKINLHIKLLFLSLHHQRKTTKKIMKISYLIKEKKPFAIIQFFEWVKLMPDEKVKVYDLLVKDSDGNIDTHRLNGSQVRYFKSNISIFDLCQNDQNGSVYEFNNFKNSLNSIGIFSYSEDEKKEGSVFFD